MEIDEIIQVHRKIEIGKEPQKIYYKSSIRGLGEGSFDIQPPSAPGRGVLFLRPREKVFVRVFVSREQFGFQTEVLKRKKGKVPLYVIKTPVSEAVERIQLRQYVGIKCLLDAKYQKVTGKHTERHVLPETEKKGLILNLSGGGLLMALNDPDLEGELLMITFYVKLQGKESRELKVQGKVVQWEESDYQSNNFKHLVEVEFEGLTERERDEIIAYIFQKMVEQKRLE